MNIAPYNELYNITSLADPHNFPDAQVNTDGSVELEWYCVKRPAPIGSYTELLLDYDSFPEPEKTNAEMWVDQLFTLEEIQQLLFYVSLKEGFVRCGFMPVPAEIWSVNYEGQQSSSANPFKPSPQFATGFTISPGEAHYSLPLIVGTYYARKR